MKRFFSLGVGTLAIAILFSAQSAQAATVVVSPDDMNGWGFLDEGPGGSVSAGSLVAGPDTPPIGDGSVELTVDDTGRIIIGTQNFNGTRLDDMDQLKYSTYRQTGGSVLAISLQMNFDSDLTDDNDSWQGRMVYEPYHVHTVNGNVWEAWDTQDDAVDGFGDGNWWFSGSPGNLVCPQSTPCTWTEVLTEFPDGGIQAGSTGALLLRAGGPWTGGFTGNADQFIIEIDGTETTVDFEAEAPPDPELICNGMEATIVGTPGNDILNGTPGPDVIVGLGGNDIINGFKGDDIICAGPGRDIVNGHRGDDWVDGGPGRDIINGQRGVDTLMGGSGHDVLNGGRRKDTLDGGDGFDICNNRRDNRINCEI